MINSIATLLNVALRVITGLFQIAEWFMQHSPYCIYGEADFDGLYLSLVLHSLTSDDRTESTQPNAAMDLVANEGGSKVYVCYTHKLAPNSTCEKEWHTGGIGKRSRAT
ncbi:unnamed protein product [Dibothriocephalus latus]|uniref:XPG-I domain-containing protein n=1 Tax=Dibothriocephalus latus TaxID=60516 RepID=A0A3P7LDN7_DIBLA|nr:unnamed protein product [Dibothriocephalus latus]